MIRKFLPSFASLCAFALVAAPVIAQDSQPTSQPAEKTASSEEATAGDSAAQGTYAVFVTTEGVFGGHLETEKAPITTENFIKLAKGEKEYTHPETGQLTTESPFKGSVIHRVIPGFVLQGGAHPENFEIMGGRKQYGVKPVGFSIPFEAHPDLTHHSIGSLSMARTNDPNSASSQFFVTLAPQPNLDDATIKAMPPAQARGYGGAGYAVFGYVTDGLDVVKEIGSYGTRGGTPKKEMRFKEIIIVEGSEADYKAELEKQQAAAAE